MILVTELRKLLHLCPVEILGLNDVPNAGEIIMAADSEKEARSTAETFISEGRKKLLDDTKHKVSLDALRADSGW